MKLLCLSACLLVCSALVAQSPNVVDFALSNARLKAAVSIRDGHLRGERLELLGSAPIIFEDDADFRVEMIWNTMRHPPGKGNNGDFFCRFTTHDFLFKKQERGKQGGDETLSLFFEGPESTGLEVQYLLAENAAYLRRRLRVFEYPNQPEFWNKEHPLGNLLHAVYPYDATVMTPAKVQKAGGFGQPIALEVGAGGLFAGLEWPSADNAFDHQRLRAGQEMGEVVDNQGIWSEPAVLAPTPDAHVKDAFMRYLDDIRVAKLRPYAMYNSWYDLRNKEYPGVKPHQAMNEENVLRVVREVRENMVKKHGITLDAFVLDDGWDVYKSAWELDKTSFPRGLKLIVDELKKTHTRLGIWYGPMGGYDEAHFIRADWFRDNGYEVTDSNLISIVGPKYAALFQKRTMDMAKDGVGYFKWDGMQFVDNKPENGGPIGIYSRRVAMKNFMRFCTEVRKQDPDMFLNLTSGTWLSPWWLRFGNTLWMDGEDYSLADVPSMTSRDSAITARDMTLYDDFRRKDLWFPAANLMTHGIIKGSIDVDAIGKGEPLTKFADEVVYYLARGVSMYELYISPDVMDQGEWDVLSQSLNWARSNFEIFNRGEMIGGDPGLSQPYGHAHFKGSRGFLALRNPDINASSLTVSLDPAQGLAKDAKDLVLERVYPTRWISPRLLKANDAVEIPLQGFEAAIYELRPLKEISEPLLAGAVFEVQASNGKEQRLALLETSPEARILNPDTLKGLMLESKTLDDAQLRNVKTQVEPFVDHPVVEAKNGGGVSNFRLAASVGKATFGVLLRPSKDSAGKGDPELELTVDGRRVTVDKVSAKGVWAWFTTSLLPGVHEVRFEVKGSQAAPSWSGTAQCWLTGTQSISAPVLRIKGKSEALPRLLPPTGRGPLELPRTVKLGEVALGVRP